MDYLCLFANSLFEKFEKVWNRRPGLSTLCDKNHPHFPQITRAHGASAGTCPPQPTHGVRTDPCSACASCPGRVCAWATICTASARVSASKKECRSWQPGRWLRRTSQHTSGAHPVPVVAQRTACGVPTEGHARLAARPCSSTQATLARRSCRCTRHGHHLPISCEAQPTLIYVLLSTHKEAKGICVRSC